MTPTSPQFKRPRIAAAFMVLFASPFVLSAQVVSKDIERQLLAARDTIWHAWFANDTAALNRMLPRASAAAQARGPGQTAWEDRASILAGARQFAGGGRRLERIDFAGTKIALDGDVAVVTSTYTTVTRGGSSADTTRGRATEVFVRDGSRWVNPFWHLEPLGAAASLREIPLPDTLGANFAIGDSATTFGAADDYDALVGFWEFRFQNRNGDGTFTPAFRGHWSFEKKPGGLLVEDHWRADNPAAPMGASTYTYRAFDPKRKVWQMLGTNSAGGEFALGLTWSAGAERFGVQRYGSAIMRIRYLPIEPNHFLWRADRSADGGRTWLRDAWTMEATRIGK
jgi:hypothetical protein